MDVVMMGVMGGALGGALSDDLGRVRDGVGDYYNPTILSRCTTNPSPCRWEKKENFDFSIQFNSNENLFSSKQYNL